MTRLEALVAWSVLALIVAALLVQELRPKGPRT